MLRRLTRLLIILVILGVVAFVASRLLGGDEDDFDDFDDLDSGFEFQETPVEIDVPASSESAADAGMSDATSSATDAVDTSAGASDTTDATGAADTSYNMGRSMGTAILQDMDETGPADNNGSNDEALTSINGIGAAYEARLNSIGINSVSDLANADAETIASQIDVIGGAATVGDWIDKAKMQQNNGQS